MCAALLVGDRPSSLPILEFVSKAASPAKKGDRIFFMERELLGMMTMWEVSRVDIFATGPQARSTLYVSNTTTLMQGGRLLLSEASDVPRSVQPP